MMLTPLCSPKFRMGEPSDECHYLAKQLQSIFVK